MIGFLFSYPINIQMAHMLVAQRDLSEIRRAARKGSDKVPSEKQIAGLQMEEFNESLCRVSGHNIQPGIHREERERTAARLVQVVYVV